MKIGVNTRLLLPGTLEGIGRFTHEILSRMVKDHPQDQFYFFFDRPYDGKYVYGDNVIPIVVKPMARTPIHWVWWFEVALPKALNKYGIDVFFSPELYTSLRAKTPSLLVAHDIAYHHFPHHFRWDHLWYLKKYTPLFLNRADKISCVSQATMNDIVKVFSIKKEKLFVAENGPTPGFIPVGYDEKLEVRKKLTAGHPYFLYLGSIHPRKNVESLIQAFEMFRKSNSTNTNKLVLVGRMAWKTKKVKKVFDSSAVKEDVLFLGQREDAASIMGGAEALIYVSLFEGFGIPILEAFQSRIPVITSNHGSMKEVAGDGAILVEPTNVAAIAQGMEKIVSDAAFSKNLVKKGTEVLKKYNWSKSANIIYDEIIKLKQVKRPRRIRQ